MACNSLRLRAPQSLSAADSPRGFAAACGMTRRRAANAELSLSQSAQAPARRTAGPELERSHRAIFAMIPSYMICVKKSIKISARAKNIFS
jgi:hypothetical protein